MSSIPSKGPMPGPDAIVTSTVASVAGNTDPAAEQSPASDGVHSSHLPSSISEPPNYPTSVLLDSSPQPTQPTQPTQLSPNISSAGSAATAAGSPPLMPIFSTSEVRRMQAAQQQRLKASYYETILEIADHLRQARILAAHIPPHRELAIVNTHIEITFCSLQALWTATALSKDFLYRCTDPEISTAELLSGAPPIMASSERQSNDGPSP